MKKVKAKGTQGDYDYEWLADVKGEKPSSNLLEKTLAAIKKTPDGSWQMTVKLTRHKNGSKVRWHLGDIPGNRNDMDRMCFLLCQQVHLLNKMAERE